MNARRALPAVLPLVVVIVCGRVNGGPDERAARETRWISDSGVRAVGFGRVTFTASDGTRLEARTYRGTAFDPLDGPIWFVMHGASRDVDRYLEVAAPVAERYGALAMVIHFPREAYPASADYPLGDRLYAELERVFDLVRESLDGRQAGYHLFGHSAGAQFTHRLLTFLPAPRVLSAVAANAGWYALPTNSDPRLHAMPYGLFGSTIQPAQLTRFFATPFTVLLGERDTTTAAEDDLVRGTPEAEAQGHNRLERGRYYFDVARAQAATLGAAFDWRLEIVPRAGHDAGRMIWSAGSLTFAPRAAPCRAMTSAAPPDLLVTEILADPPAGAAGDANADGVRDAADDEFVEIVNRGAAPACLAGWTLGDAAQRERHVFPLGPALGPGEVIVVFGGGVPTGAFAGGVIQVAADRLSLQASGDVLTLRDAQDRVVQQVSWGNCAGAPCAADHQGSLAIGGSVTRALQPGAAWTPHVTAAGGARFSPGIVSGANPVKNGRGRGR
jgi:hypothetical protein